MLCVLDNIRQNISHIQSEYGEYFAYHCYGFEQCYAISNPQTFFFLRLDVELSQVSGSQMDTSLSTPTSCTQR